MYMADYLKGIPPGATSHHSGLCSGAHVYSTTHLWKAGLVQVCCETMANPKSTVQHVIPLKVLLPVIEALRTDC